MASMGPPSHASHPSSWSAMETPLGAGGGGSSSGSAGSGLGTSYEGLPKCSISSSGTSSTSLGAAGGGGVKRDRDHAEGVAGAEAADPKRQKEEGTAAATAVTAAEASATTASACPPPPPPPPPGGGNEEVETLRKELRRKEAEYKATEDQLLDQLAKERSAKEAMLAGRGQLEQALRGALGSVEDVRTKLTASEEQRKALALATAEVQQLLGAVRPEAVVPVIQALKRDKERLAAAETAAAAAAIQALEKDKERVAAAETAAAAAEAEGKAARGALQREVIKAEQAKERANKAEKAKVKLEERVQQLQTMMDAFPEEKRRAVQELEKKVEVLKTEMVLLKAQIQALQQAQGSAKLGKEQAEATAVQGKAEAERWRKVAEEQMTRRKLQEERAEAAIQRAEAAEASARQAQEELGRVRSHSSRTQFLEEELQRFREKAGADAQHVRRLREKAEADEQHVKRLRDKAAEDAREKARLDEGWAKESARLERVRGERAAAQRGWEEEKALRREAESGRQQAKEQAAAAAQELATFKASYGQFTDWLGQLCQRAGIEEAEDDRLNAFSQWVLEMRREQERRLERRAQVEQAEGGGGGVKSAKAGGMNIGHPGGGGGGVGGMEQGEAAASGDCACGMDHEGYNAMVALHNEAQKQLKDAKDMLLDLWERVDDLVPARYFGKISVEEIQEALIKDEATVKGKKQLEALESRIDGDLRDVQWDPFVRWQGHIEGVKEDDARLKSYTNQFGKNLADLVLAKCYEIEAHCKNGHYPTKLLATPEGEVLTLPEALSVVLGKLVPDTDAAAEADTSSTGGGGGGGGGGGASSSSSSSSSRHQRRRG